MKLVLLAALVATASAAGPAVTSKVFFDISIDGIGKGRILMELFDDTVPKTVNNLCGHQLQAPFNLGSPAVGVRCCSLDTVECGRGTSCPSLGLSDDRGAEIAIT